MICSLFINSNTPSGGVLVLGFASFGKVLVDINRPVAFRFIWKHWQSVFVWKASPVIQLFLDLKWDVWGGLSMCCLQLGNHHPPPWSREMSGVYDVAASQIGGMKSHYSKWHFFAVVQYMALCGHWTAHQRALTKLDLRLFYCDWLILNQNLPFTVLESSFFSHQTALKEYKSDVTAWPNWQSKSDNWTT